MNRIDTLRSLESTLESFLTRAVCLYESQTGVCEGVNRLSDIASNSDNMSKLTEQIGNWFAEHREWATGDTILSADRSRINKALSSIQNRLTEDQNASPAINKIVTEIDRWRTNDPAPQQTKEPDRQTIVLRRGPEMVNGKEADSIGAFSHLFDRVTNLYHDASGNKKHIMSVLDDTLKSASLQRNRDALVLSAFIIYHLKLNGYKVSPFVKRLKEAERAVRGDL